MAFTDVRDRKRDRTCGGLPVVIFSIENSNVWHLSAGYNVSTSKKVENGVSKGTTTNHRYLNI